MTIQLPPLPLEQFNLTLMSKGTDHTPTQGAGPTQRTLKLGDRWKLDAEVRPLRSDQGKRLQALLNQGLMEKLRVHIPDSSKATNGIVVSGMGRSLAVTGATGVQVGDYFSLIHAGIHHLHQVTGVSGGNLAILPALKVTPTSGDVVSFTTPVIEGFIEGLQQSAGVRFTGSMRLSFSIVEAQ